MNKVIITRINICLSLTFIIIFFLNININASTIPGSFDNDISNITRDLNRDKNYCVNNTLLKQKKKEDLVFLLLCLTAFKEDFESFNFQSLDSVKLEQGKIKLCNGKSVLPGTNQRYYDYDSLLELYKNSIPDLHNESLFTKSNLTTFHKLKTFRVQLLRHLILRYSNFKETDIEIDEVLGKRGLGVCLSTDIIDRDFFCEYYPKHIDRVETLNEKIKILTDLIRYQTRFNAAKFNETPKDFNDSFLFFLMLAHCFERVWNFDYVVWPKFEYRKSINILDNEKYFVVRYFPTRNNNAIHASILNEIPIEIIRSWNSIVNDKWLSFEKLKAVAIIALQAVNYSIRESTKYIKAEFLEHQVSAYEHILKDAINRKIIDYDGKEHNNFLNKLLKSEIFDASLLVELENGRLLTEKDLLRPQGFNVKDGRIDGFLRMINTQLKDDEHRRKDVDVNINFVAKITDVGTFPGYKEKSRFNNIRISQKYFFYKETRLSDHYDSYHKEKDWKSIIESEVKKDPLNIFKPYLRDLVPVNNREHRDKKVIEDLAYSHIDTEIKAVNGLDLIGFTSTNSFPYISAIRFDISESWKEIFKLRSFKY